MLKKLNTSTLLYTVLLSSFLFGCQTTTVKKDNTPVVNASLASADQTSSVYLAQANQSSLPEKRDRYLLLAANAYISDGNLNAASDVLNGMQKNLVQVPSLQAEHIYLRALIAEKAEGNARALAVLNYAPQWQLPQWQMVNYHQFKARLYKATKQPIERVKHLSLLSSYLPKSEITKVNDVIWKILQPLSEETISKFMRDPSNPVFSGWLNLAYTAKRYSVDPTQLVRQLGEWQRNNPNHPATMKMPADLTLALSAKPYKPQNIAVLLPLTGPRARIADPIKQGILASYLKGKANNATVNFYDTQEGVDKAYKQAIAEGAGFVIGPLLADEVQVLQRLTASMPQSVPQLYLNQVDHFEPKSNQFYFSLSPNQEANDAAVKLFNDGVKNPLLLASNDAIGKRMAESFNSKWNELASTTAEVHFYDAGDKMKQTVQVALGVLNSEARIARMKQVLGNNLEAVYRSRQDIDAIYMISGAQDLTLLKAFLDVNFSVFAEPVALYTTSRSRLEHAPSQSTKELNNLMISDIPWLMQTSDETAMVNDLWSSWNNSQKRLYIMGYDSLDLVNRLAQMRAFPGFQFNARSGALTVDPKGVIDRKLTWGKYEGGVLRPL